MTIHIKEVYASEFMLEHIHLVRKHWLEVGYSVELEPDVERYAELEQAGILHTLAAYSDDEAIGYCSIGIAPHAHSKNELCAMVDAIYIEPDHRGFASAKLMTAVKQKAAELNAFELIYFTKRGTPLYKSLVKHGYEETETVMTIGLR